MEGGVIINDVYKDIRNIVNKDNIDQEFLDTKTMRENPLTNIRNVLDDESNDREWLTFGGSYFDPHYTEFIISSKEKVWTPKSITSL